ncbi:efflux RND transporter periplasmic adaptor subunit [Humitalea sp. 24SJ18S-53]|uniref:efflux RND transporter periplasmic adaptor subunit n=1 Tax=Humitalea sp. 24SJ18S-53 TaxID=3422307 RepID=UPI003D6685B2
MQHASLFRPGRRIAALLLLGALPLLGCKEQNAYVPPPPPKVTVSTPLRQPVTRFVETVGTAASVNTVDLVARVGGFLQQIGFRDGDPVRRGTPLFVIEPQPYQAALSSAQGAEAAARAQLANAQVEFDRQSTLLRQNVTAQATFDQAQAKRDEARGALQQAEANTITAQINLSYTTVLAPFDGIMTRHLASIGEVVGGTTQTRLATIVQHDPIWVNFTISETDLLRVRQALVHSGLRSIDLDKVVIEVAIQGDNGFPHVGTLDYFSPVVDAATGTMAVRGVFPNPNRVLLPGFFLRVRVPLPSAPGAMSLLVPDSALGADQAGRYLLVVNAQNTVEQRTVEIGPRVGTLRVIESGLQPDDKVVIAGIQRAIPGHAVEPEQGRITAPAVQAVPAAPGVMAPIPTPILPNTGVGAAPTTAPAPAPAPAR